MDLSFWAIINECQSKQRSRQFIRVDISDKKWLVVLVVVDAKKEGRLDALGKYYNVLLPLLDPESFKTQSNFLFFIVGIFEITRRF